MTYQPPPLNLHYNEVICTLLRYNADVNIEDATRQTPLHHAVRNGRFQVARTLLRRHANANAPDNERNTPLRVAARVGQANIIKLLLDGGATVESYSRIKEIPLHLAIHSPEAVEILLNAHGDRIAAQTAIDVLSQTPLHLAVRGKYYKSVRVLRWPADFEARDDDGWSPMYYAIDMKDLSTVKSLCEDRSDLQNSQDWMHTALVWAVEASAPDVLEFLLSLSAEPVNKLDVHGHTMVHKASGMKSPEILALLLRFGADINVLEGRGTAPLHDAAGAGRFENIRKLIVGVAEVNKVDEDGRHLCTWLLSAMRSRL